ncbi:MAG: ATP synthase F0 subunit B [bacterium]|nr:ATP synthase F0 subunit B [bacterium]
MEMSSPEQLVVASAEGVAEVAPAAEITTQTEQPTHDAEHHAVAPDVMSFDGTMVMYTWIAFLVAAIILGKALWKPILKFIEARESEISQSMENARMARKAAADADIRAAETIAAAEKEARILADARLSDTRAQVAQIEADARQAIVERRAAAEVALAEERETVLRELSGQAGAEIARALEKVLPGLLDEQQRKVYQDRIAAEIDLH